MKTTYYALAFGLLLMSGCEKPNGELLPEKAGLTVANSREWLENNPSTALENYIILWDLGSVDVFHGQPVVTIPIYNHSSGIEITGDTLSESRVLDGRSLIFYPDDTGNITASVMAKEITRNSEDTEILFFDYQNLHLQSIWQAKNGKLSGMSGMESKHLANAKIEECGYFDKWVNQCNERNDRNTNPATCWIYVGRVWSCHPNFSNEVPGTGGGSGGGGTIGGGGFAGGGSGGTGPLPGSGGIFPLIKRSFVLNIGEDKLSILLNNQVSSKLLPFIFEANVNHQIYFTNEEIQYLETFPSEDLQAMTEWLKTFKDIEIPFIENKIRGLKNSFVPAEKQVLMEYSGNNIMKYRLNVLRYGANAYNAGLATQAYFFSTIAANCPSCKGNAFKHALFRIFDAVSFGQEMSRRLGEAHEAGQEPNPATLMDKKNNAAGLRIYDAHRNGGTGTFYWGSKVGEAMKNGDLVFLINDQEISTNIDDPSIPGPL